MAPIAPPKKISPSSSSLENSLGGGGGGGGGSGGGKRLTARQKAAMRLQNPLIPRKVHRPEANVSDSFINSKRDKRLIKHSSFVSKIAAASKVGKSSSLKRRRPSKKLVTTLESLGDALDDIVARDGQDPAKMMDAEQALQGKIRHKSLKSRPGALKRKEKVVKGEMERFGRSLAQLASVTETTITTSTNTRQGGGGAQSQDQDMGVEEAGAQPAAAAAAPTCTATSNRWAALRGFISATMEQNPAFLAQNQQQK